MNCTFKKIFFITLIMCTLCRASTFKDYNSDDEIFNICHSLHMDLTESTTVLAELDRLSSPLVEPFESYTLSYKLYCITDAQKYVRYRSCNYFQINNYFISKIQDQPYVIDGKTPLSEMLIYKAVDIIESFINNKEYFISLVNYIYEYSLMDNLILSNLIQYAKADLNKNRKLKKGMTDGEIFIDNFFSKDKNLIRIILRYLLSNEVYSLKWGMKNFEYG